ncbi:hypothetical protein SOCEGT47_066510 [Sorangium cellulosum]|jgi:hypothetical protein|uniref:Uncharacterized protein n=1 Tax=Sorangium cellulosum TaxID=56 RepID=A0A4V0NEG5_SORCE|nr:DUF3634 family protein [Sorangium cellulosum]AUX26092.1 hypothetical protein SOCEGT47_066510 [Sorangium cellulosum]
MSLLIPLALLAVTIPLIVALLRANELFYVRVEGRNVRLLRGRLPQRLLDDITDVLRAAPIDRGAVRVVVEDRRPRVHVEGDISPEQAQQLRNTVSMWPIAKIRAAPKRRVGA